MPHNYYPCISSIRSVKRIPKEKMFGVTEATQGGNIIYYIKLEDARNWYTLKVDVDGNSQLVGKV
jgi:hypothetical protein